VFSQHRSATLIDVDVGRVRYARNGDVRLAYRVFGEGEHALVWNPGWFSNVDLYDDPTLPFAPFVEELTQATRLIVWDKRGTGLSDPVTHVPPLDERMEDLHAVIAAAEAVCPAMFGMSEGGPMSILFAATYPEHVRSLVLYGVGARFSQELPDHPWGLTADQIAEHRDEIEKHWGEGALADVFFGPLADIPGFRDFYGKLQRACASPTMALMLWQALMEMDVRGVLSSVRTPTLVLARHTDQVATYDGAAALAAAITGAEFRELPSGPHSLLDIALGSEIVNFVCDKPNATTNERLLTTVLFTDIVGSTEELSAQGDAQWRRQLDVHDKLVDSVLARYGGRRAKHTGDGIFALFDGPTRAARCGLELVPALATRGIRIRAGIHTGECERRGDEWSGIAVHTGARIGALAGPGEVITSRTVRDLSAGSGLIFESLGAHRLKGLAEETEVFRVSKPAGGPL
jgi:class 3 adenylate cyclase/pimeloyl-ACP methyl ester carboxylesterase